MSDHRPGVNFQVLMETKDYNRIGQLSPAFLAYIGDAVYELYVRTSYLLPPRKIADYHNQVVAQVRAETQAEALQKLMPHLTAVEQDMVRRGRNAATGCPRRLRPEIYQQATSLETLIGYLYLQDNQRLNELLETLIQ
jgi:ribonuclease-3 family protein